MAPSAIVCSPLELSLGYRFADPRLLTAALTHSSASADGVADLERLEFLGDRVLGILAAELLFRSFPDQSEGEMSPRFNAMVRKETCAAAARHLRLGPALRLSPGEERAGGRGRDAILGDAMEALLGAVYLDGGLEAARGIFDQFWTLRRDALIADPHDAKTALQEWAQDKGHGTPRYQDVARSGPDHAPHFVVEAIVGRLLPVAGTGSSKREAQTHAARTMLIRERVWREADRD